MPITSTPVRTTKGMVYNPKEATEDSHALNLAILFFAGGAVLVSIILHHDSGLKYFLLDQFGKSVVGTILSVSEVPEDESRLETAIRKDRRNTLKNARDWTSGKIVVVAFEPQGAGEEIKVFRMPRAFHRPGTSNRISIIYLPQNPQIAYPADYLSDYEFDEKVLFWSLTAGGLIAVLAFVTARRWARYRNWLRRY